MSRDVKPSDVQVVLSMHPARVQEFASWLNGRTLSLDCLASDIASQIKSQEHGRRLAVINYEDREQVERFREIASRWADQVSYSDMRGPVDMDHADAMQAALREFADPPPPKPDEPGLYGVVETRDGKRWFKAKEQGLWHMTNDVNANSTQHRVYSSLDVVTVLSDGVS